MREEESIELVDSDIIFDASKSSGILYSQTVNNYADNEFLPQHRNLKASRYAQPMNICVWKENFIGRTWEDWASGYYGKNWDPCKINPVDGVVWGVDGVCDDGKQGSGACICKKSWLDPNKFCESHIDIEKEKHEEEQFTEGIVVLLFLAFSITIMVYIHSKVEWLEIFPESIWAIFIGIGLGCFLKYYYKDDKDESGLSRRLQFEPRAFFLFLLPPIMFQAGFSLRTSTFFRNLGTINAFAVGATTVAAFSFSFVFYYGMLDTDQQLGYLDSLHFGCIMSAIDPVATISIFQSLHVNDKIYMIVFGEASLNDAVAIALSSSTVSLQEKFGHGITPDYFELAVNTLVYFTVFFFVSLIVGWLISIFTSLIFVKLELDLFPWLEIGIFLQCAYLPYIVAEALGLSGVLAILIGGITMRNYAFHSLSPCSKITIEYLIETVGYICENFVFAYLGISIPLMLKYVNLYGVIVGIVSLVSSRLISVMVIAGFVNCCRREKIPLSHQIVMTHGGLRGAVAFYLALNITTKYKDILTTMTIVLIFFTVVGLGSTTNPLLRLLNKCCPRDKILWEEEDEEDEAFLEDLDLRSDGKSEGVITRLENLDAQFGQKFLRKGYKRNMDRIKSSMHGSMHESDHGEGDGGDEVTSLASRHEEVMDIFFNREVRGGDMSPYRTGKLLFMQRNKKKTSELKLGKTEKSIPLGVSKKKTSMLAGKIERFEGPAVELPGLTTTKAVHSKTRQLDGGFGSYLSPPKTPDEVKKAETFSAGIKNVIEEPSNEEIEAENRDIVKEPPRLKDKSKSDSNVLKGLNKRQKYQKKLSTLLEEDEEQEDDKDNSKKKNSSAEQKEEKDNKLGKDDEQKYTTE